MFANIFYNFKNNRIHIWEYLNDKRVHIEEDYQPYCYIYDEKGEYKDLWNKSCKIKTFENYYKQREFIDKIDTLEGDIHPEDRTLVDRYHKIKEFETLPDLDIHYIDIETMSDGGFPSADNPKNEILLISIFSTKLKKFYVFGTYDYTPASKLVEYIWCNDEEELLKKYFNWHRENYPDIITGWNTRYFDIPYILNRAKYSLSETFVNRYSPIGIIKERTVEGRQIYDIAGISQLDYLELYKSFSANERESYKLDYIAILELGKGKTKFDGDLNNLWRTNFKLYVEYNINDTLLVKKLEDKLGYIKLVQSQSYMCRVPFEKYGSSIKKFDNYLMTILKDKKIVLPTTKHNTLSKELPGGYVSETSPGYYEKVVSYDFTSLYPHIIQALNISPETYLGRIVSSDNADFTELDLTKIIDTAEYIISGKMTTGKKLKEFIIKNNLILSPNGSLYKSQTGFIPGIMKEMFSKRKEYKNKMKECEKMYKKTKDEEYNKKRSVYDGLQNSTKILLNSGYGIMANPHYRLFSYDNASSITLTGQKLAKYTGKELNEYLKKEFKYNDKEIILYQDTDSVYVNFANNVVKDMNNKDYISYIDEYTKTKLYPFLEKIFFEFNKNQHNITQNYFDLKREKICIGAILIQKKKYALYVIDSEGVTYDEPELKVTGMEIVRSSTPSFCREKIKEIVYDLFNTKCSDKDFIINKLKDTKKQFKVANISEIAFPRNVNNLDTYVDKNGNMNKGIPIHCRGSILYNRLIKKNNLESKYDLIHNSDKIKFIYLNANNPIKENIIAFKDELPKEFGFEKYLDIETQFDKSFMSPILKITEALQWDINLNESDISSFF